MPALDEVVCPHCGAANHGQAITVWTVADERGVHCECDGCAHEWPIHPRTATDTFVYRQSGILRA